MKFRMLALLLTSVALFAGDYTEIQLKSITPDDLIRELHLQEAPSEGYVFKVDGQSVRILINDATNKVMIIGSAAATQNVSEIIGFLDVPPRQILIEVQIVEVNRQVASDIGLDWQDLMDAFKLDLGLSSNEIDTREELVNPTPGFTKQIDYTKTLSAGISTTDMAIGDVVNLLVETGAGQISSSPRIVTTNNRAGSILDGQHTTYVARYSSYADVYETKELNTGLSLTVTPSISDNDYITLDLEAKYTTLTGNLGGSPIETGQILNNRVIVKDNEPFLLGAFKRNVTQEGKKKVPILGTILPFIFSSKYNYELEQDILLVVTPRIINLEGSAVPEK